MTFNLALQMTVILIAACGVALALRRASADLRHSLWLIALLAIAMLPILALAAPKTIPPALRLTTSSILPAATVAARAIRRAMPITSLVWMAGSAALLLRLTVGLFRISGITKRARMSPSGVLLSAEISTPLTWGFVRPAILLPAYAAEWSEEKLDLVIAHERAHIARRDWLWQTLASVVAAVFWFHPLVWVAIACLRREAEIATDDLVLAKGARAADYAEQLLDVARRMSQRAPAMAVAMTRRSELETRVREILSARGRQPASRWARVGAVLAFGALLVPLAAMQQSDDRETRNGRTVYHMNAKGLAQPRLISKVEPAYTEEARAAKIQGTVGIQCTIGEDGKAEDFTITQSLDDGLDANAIEAIQQWRFQPATKDGEPVPVRANIEVNFRLL
jgi:TonB family protein